MTILSDPISHGPWKILATTELYRDPWFTLRKDDVIRPDGLPGTYTVATLKPGVSVLALDDQGCVHLTKEFHYGVGRVTVEVVSGAIEGNEAPLVSAQRELAEELGIEADRWTHLGRIDPITGSVVSPIELFLAQELRFGEPQLEGTEIIQRVSMPLEEALTWVMDGRISHSASGILLFKTHRLLRAV